MEEATFLSKLDLEVPEDGTLSKVIYKDEQIRVVAFAFDEGQELTEHTASVPAIVEVVSGHIRLSLGSRIVDARPGSWTHLPARLPHGVVAMAPSVMLLTLIRC